jgi:transposase
MELVHARCAGLDVHKATVVACVRVPGAQPGERNAERQSFRTTLRGLRELLAWLISHGVTHVAMESTGVYWRPVFAVLEGSIHVRLVNARHVKMVPGRKTDVRDCEWLAQLLECGLLRGSFVPPAAVRDLRDLTRLRKTLIRERGHHVNRIEKILELANLKIGTVITDIMGKTGRAILQALSAGLDDPAPLAARAEGLLRKKQAALPEAAEGRMTPHYAFLLQRHLALIDTLDDHIATLDPRIEAAMAPFAETAALVQTMPGVRARAAQAILAETGMDMSPFPTAQHFASWARLCPGNHESAGKRRPATTGKGRRLVAGHPARGRLGRGQDQEKLLPGPLSPAERPARPQEGHRRRAARDARRPVAHTHAPRVPPGPRSRLLRPPQHCSDPTPPCPPARTAWLPGDPRRRTRGLTHTKFHRKRRSA